jgi:hypothetical protein
MAKKKDDFEDDFGTPVGESGFEDMPVSDDMPSGEASRPNWLKPVHVGRATSGTLQVVRVLPENTQYSDIVLLVEIADKKQYQLGMKLFSDDYKSLLKKFGPKRSGWNGAVRYKVIANNGKPYIAVRG